MSGIDVVASGLDFAALHARMQWYIDREILPCVSTLVLRNLEVLDYRCFGYMDVESRTPLRDDAIYRMFSNTKPITSVALLQLLERGQCALDDPVGEYIPVLADLRVLAPGATSVDQTVPSARPVTLRHLLCHQAGFSYGFLEPESVIDRAYLNNGLDVMAGFGGTLADLMVKLAEFPLVFQPGTGFRYSLATDVLARVVEVVSGASFDVYLGDNIFTPLGMSDTGFCVAPANLERLVTLAAPADPARPMAGGLVQLGAANSGPTRNPRWLSGGGGLFSTAADYLTFIRMLISGGQWGGERILRSESVASMRVNQLPQNVRVSFPDWQMPDTGFGFGFAVHLAQGEGDSGPGPGEYHWGGLAGTHSWASPAGVGGLCMSQLMPGFWHPFSHDFRRFAYDIVG